MAYIDDIFTQYAPPNDFDLAVYTIVLSAIISKVLFHVSQLLSPLFSVSYSHLSPAMKADWDTRTVSTIHAVVMTYLSYHLLFFDPKTSWGFYNSPTNYTSRLGIFTQAILAGYLISDTWIVWQYRKGISSVNSTLFHHIISLIGIIYGLIWRVTHYYPLIFALSEASTPFVNIRWWLYSAGMKHTKRYVVAGLLMTASFFLVRIVLVPYVVFHSYYRMGLDHMLALPWSQFIMTMFFPAMGNSLNLFWFGLIVKGLVKTLRGGGGEEKRNGKEIKKVK